MNFQSLIDFNGWTFIAQICNLFLQMYLFKRFLFKPVKKIIEKRQQEINQTYADAEASRLDAESAKADYEAHLQSAHAEAEAITSRAISSAKERSEQLLKEAADDASAMREKASRDIALERRKAMDEVKGEISDLAVQIASKVAQKEIAEADHEALVSRFIDELGDEA